MGTERTLTLLFLFQFVLFSLPLSLDSTLFLFAFALFSPLLRNPPFDFPFLLNLLPLSDVLGRFGLQLFLLALLRSGTSFLFLCLTGSRPLVLLVALFGLLLFALLDPALGGLAHGIGLLGPLFCHHVSTGHLLSSQHRCVHRQLSAL